MIVLFCVDGNKKGVECNYVVEYPHSTLAQIAAQAVWKWGTKGYDCPWCHKWPLKVKQV